MKALAERYSLLLEWSDADSAYIATVAELDGAKIHGATRAAALAAAEELIVSWLATEDNPPAPRQFDRHYAAEGHPWTEPGYDATTSVGLAPTPLGAR